MASLGTSVRYKSDEKRRHAIMLAIVLFILGIAMIVVGTYAYYQTSINGVIEGTIARWIFKANNNTSSFTVNLTPSQSGTTESGTVAPGTSGSISIVLTTIDSPNTGELPAEYTITFSNFTNVPTNLKFYSDQNFQTETNIQSNGYSITGTLAANNSITKTIYWKWGYGDASTVAQDNADANKAVSFTMTVAGKQLTP